MAEQIDENPRNKFAGLIAGLKETLSRKQEELDAEGVQRKMLTPEQIDAAQAQLAEAVPEISDEVMEAVLQVFADVMAAEQPETDVEEEMDVEEAAFDEEEEKVDEEERVAALAEQVAEMGKAYNALIADVSEVVQLTHKAFEGMNTQTKQHDGLIDRIAALEKQLAAKPRRASQAPETEVDPGSAVAKSVKQQQVVVPNGYEAFADMFKD